MLVTVKTLNWAVPFPDPQGTTGVNVFFALVKNPLLTIPPVWHIILYLSKPNWGKICKAQHVIIFFQWHIKKLLQSISIFLEGHKHIHTFPLGLWLPILKASSVGLCWLTLLWLLEQTRVWQSCRRASSTCQGLAPQLWPWPLPALGYIRKIHKNSYIRLLIHSCVANYTV